MAFINKHDTNGTKGLLAKGELGYDDYSAGGDTGRVYVGTGSVNIPQAKKAEVVAVDGKVDTHVVRVDNPHSVTKTQVGLGNVQDVDTTNASNITSGTLANVRLANSGVTAGTYKSVTVDGKGIVTGGTNPTTLSGYSITDAYTKTETNTQISTAVNGLVDTAPGTLDTLNELAAALGDDPNFATTTANAIAAKVPKVTSTDNAIVRFDGTTGVVQNSNVIIDDNNNVGLGVTPSAWYGGNHIQTLYSAFGENASGHADIQNNSYEYAYSVYKYIISGVGASKYTANFGNHYWSIAPSGTAGNPITWTDAMTLGSNGNLLVGTTTDNGVDKLQVNGTFISSRRSGAYVGKTLFYSTFNDNLSHSVTSNSLANQSFIVEISSVSGVHSFPVYCFGGNGIGYRFNYLNPGDGTWVNTSGNNLSLVFTEQGDSPNTYAFLIISGNGNATIQATTKNSPYSICITTI